MAHVKNEETQAWWRFDDEATSSMERGPVGEAGDHGVQATPIVPGKVTRPASCPRCGGKCADCRVRFVRWYACGRHMLYILILQINPCFRFWLPSISTCYTARPAPHVRSPAASLGGRLRYGRLPQFQPLLR